MNNLLVIGPHQANTDIILNAALCLDIQGQQTTTLKEGMERLDKEDYALLVVDPALPDGDGLSLISKTANTVPRPETIVLTNAGDPEEAERAIKFGAWDYLTPPLTPDDVKRILSRALFYRREQKHRRDDVTASLDRRKIIGDSAPIMRCLDQVHDAAATDINVLIVGETGTGKELFAEAIHRNSSRRDNGLVVVDCASLPKTLVESTLFGYEKGAFTGADRPQEGLIKQANQGTLFLDEIGELPLGIQKKFLRVLQERTFRPVGSKQLQRSEFRLVAATNRNLVQMAANGEFREDLLFRLKALTIALPPLRKRKDDLEALVHHHMRRICRRYDLPTKRLSDDFIDVLSAYSWPGNVRELNQAVEYALISAGPNDVLFSQDLPVEVRAKIARTAVDTEPDGHGPADDRIWDNIRLPNPLPTVKDLRDRALDELFSKYTRQLIRQTAGNAEEARRIAGLSRSRIYALLKKYGPSKSDETDNLSRFIV